jgi:hypothetical protein
MDDKNKKPLQIYIWLGIFLIASIIIYFVYIKQFPDINFIIFIISIYLSILLGLIAPIYFIWLLIKIISNKSYRFNKIICWIFLFFFINMITILYLCLPGHLRAKHQG